MDWIQPISLVVFYICSISIAYHVGRILEIKKSIVRLEELRGEFESLQKKHR